MKTKVDEEDLLTMAGPAYPTGNNHPLAMTAPKPRLHHHRLFNNNSDCCGESSASGGSGSFHGGCGDTEEIIRKNLFALPLVVQNEIFRTKSTATNHHRSQMIHQRPSTGCKPPRSTLPTIGGGNSPKKMIGAGEGGAATCGKQSSVSVNRRTGSDEFCGLSAEIYREIANRTPQKMNANAAVETPTRTTEKRSVPKAPVSRDLFRAKSSVSAFFPPATDGTLSIQLTPTKSMSSGSGSEGGSPAHRGSKRGLPDNGSNGASGVTPKTLPHKKQRTTTARKTPFASSSSARKKLQKSLTPPRNTFGSHMKLYRASSAAAATLGSSFDGVDDYRPTSTELDPSPFQVELPSKKEVMVYSRICALMDGYTSVHRDFNFAMLSGVSHPTLRRECDRSTPERPMIAGSCHRDVVGGLLGCHDDIVVEGFFREYTAEEKDRESERIEACILSSESLRQIIVCFRGSTTNQAKPLRNSMFGREGACRGPVFLFLPSQTTHLREFLTNVSRPNRSSMQGLASFTKTRRCKSSTHSVPPTLERHSKKQYSPSSPTWKCVSHSSMSRLRDTPSVLPWPPSPVSGTPRRDRR